MVFFLFVVNFSAFLPLSVAIFLAVDIDWNSGLEREKSYLQQKWNVGTYEANEVRQFLFLKNSAVNAPLLALQCFFHYDVVSEAIIQEMSQDSYSNPCPLGHTENTTHSFFKPQPRLLRRRDRVHD